MSQPNHTHSDPYNYAVFEAKEDFVGFRTIVQVGSAAPDFGAILLETGQAMCLSDFWRERDVLVEFGSLT